MYRVFRDDIVCMDKLPLPSATLNGADPFLPAPGAPEVPMKHAVAWRRHGVA